MTPPEPEPTEVDPKPLTGGDILALASTHGGVSVASFAAALVAVLVNKGIVSLDEVHALFADASIAENPQECPLASEGAYQHRTD